MQGSHDTFDTLGGIKTIFSALFRSKQEQLHAREVDGDEVVAALGPGSLGGQKSTGCASLAASDSHAADQLDSKAYSSRSRCRVLRSCAVPTRHTPRQTPRSDSSSSGRDSADSPAACAQQYAGSSHNASCAADVLASATSMSSNLPVMSCEWSDPTGFPAGPWVAKRGMARGPNGKLLSSVDEVYEQLMDESPRAADTGAGIMPPSTAATAAAVFAGPFSAAESFTSRTASVVSTICLGSQLSIPLSDAAHCDGDLCGEAPLAAPQAVWDALPPPGLPRLKVGRSSTSSDNSCGPCMDDSATGSATSDWQPGLSTFGTPESAVAAAAVGSRQRPLPRLRSVVPNSSSSYSSITSISSHTQPARAGCSVTSSGVPVTASGASRVLFPGASVAVAPGRLPSTASAPDMLRHAEHAAGGDLARHEDSIREINQDNVLSAQFGPAHTKLLSFKYCVATSPLSQPGRSPFGSPRASREAPDFGISSSTTSSSPCPAARYHPPAATAASSFSANSFTSSGASQPLGQQQQQQQQGGYAAGVPAGYARSFQTSATSCSSPLAATQPHYLPCQVQQQQQSQQQQGLASNSSSNSSPLLTEAAAAVADLLRVNQGGGAAAAAAAAAEGVLADPAEHAAAPAADDSAPLGSPSSLRTMAGPGTPTLQHTIDSSFPGDAAWPSNGSGGAAAAAAAAGLVSHQPSWSVTGQSSTRSSFDTSSNWGSVVAGSRRSSLVDANAPPRGGCMAGGGSSSTTGHLGVIATGGGPMVDTSSCPSSPSAGVLAGNTTAGRVHQQQYQQQLYVGGPVVSSSCPSSPLPLQRCQAARHCASTTTTSASSNCSAPVPVSLLHVTGHPSGYASAFSAPNLASSVDGRGWSSVPLPGFDPEGPMVCEEDSPKKHRSSRAGVGCGVTNPSRLSQNSAATERLGLLTAHSGGSWSYAEPPQLLPELPQVDFIERIGKGCFGEVYKGIWNDSVVAVKVISARRHSHSTVGDREQQLSMELARHEYESWINANLRHPNIMQLFTSFTVCLDASAGSSSDTRDESSNKTNSTSSSSSSSGGSSSTSGGQQRPITQGTNLELLQQQQQQQEQEQQAEHQCERQLQLAEEEADAVAAAAGQTAPDAGAQGTASNSLRTPDQELLVQQQQQQPAPFQEQQQHQPDVTQAQPTAANAAANQAAATTGGAATGSCAPLNSGCTKNGSGSSFRWKTHLVMEYCDMGTLQAAIRSGWFKCANGQPRMDYVLATAKELSAAVAYLHTMDVVHGDLKGTNVLLKGGAITRHDGRGFVAKVADFGLSRVMDVTGDAIPVTQQGFGALTHAAPELLCGQTLCAACDAFSVGVLLWELVTGEAAFAGVHPGEVLSLKIQHPTADLLHFPAGTAPQVIDLAHSCWAPEPAERPPMTAVVAKLNSIALQLLGVEWCLGMFPDVARMVSMRRSTSGAAAAAAPGGPHASWSCPAACSSMQLLQQGPQYPTP